MIPSQNVPIRFGKGVDTKSDPKTVALGSLLRLQDAVQVKANQWAKRNGYSKVTPNIIGGGTITSPKLMTTFKDELVCADSVLGKLYGYSPTQQGWVSRGTYIPAAVTKKIVSRYNNGNPHKAAASAVLGNIAVFAWICNDALGAIQCSVIDLNTGVNLISNYIIPGSQITSSLSAPSCVLIGGTTLGIVFQTASGVLNLMTLSLSAGVAAFNASVILTSNVTTDFDVTPTPSGAAVVYGSTSGGSSVKTLTFNSAGAVINSASVSISGSAAYRIMYEPGSGNIWIYWVESSGTTISYAVYSSSLAVVLARTVIITPVAQTFYLSIAQGATGTQTVLYSFTGTGLTNGVDALYTTNKIVVTSAGVVGSATLFVQNVTVYSKVFTLNSVQYIAVRYFSTAQGTFFFLNVADGSVLAKTLPGAASLTSFEFSVPSALSSNSVIVPVSEVYEASDVFTNYVGTTYILLDLANQDLNQSVESNSNLLLNGGQISAYDGYIVTELGFHLAPALFTVNQTTGGSLPNGTYEVFATYQSVDNQGNVYESAPSIGKNITLTGANNAISFNVSTLTMTAKMAAGSSVSILIYITQAGGTVAYHARTFANDLTVNTLSLVVGTIPTTVPIYTSGNVVANSAPPAALAMALHNNRVWLVPSETPYLIWYSEAVISTAGINFSALLLVDIDSVGGDITALAAMDDKLVIFEKHQPLILVGDGAGPTGLGSTLSNAQPIPADTGVLQSKGIITFPGGVICKTPKGIYLLDRALQFKYFGINVEGYNGQRITDATMVEDKNQIRFLTDSGLTLVYDYIFDQWSTFTNHQGYSACAWAGGYVYGRTDGKIYQETPGTYLDDTASFAPLIRTSWLALAGLQGFQRVRGFEMLGDYVNGLSASHGVQVSAAYDFIESFSAPIPYVLGSASSSGSFQYEEGLPRQKCDSISLIIQEITTGDSAEYISFTDMSFEAGMKRGRNKLPQARRVG